MDLTPKQQASEAIRQAESILLVTAQRPNIDQIASMVALAHALRKMGKKVASVVTDRVPKGADFIARNVVETSLNGMRDFIMQVDLGKAEVDKVKYTVENGKLNVHVTPFRGGFTQADVTFSQGDYHFDLIISLGVPSRSRLDRIFEQNPNLLATVPMLNLDYHRINEQHGAINLIESNSSTLSEMVLALTESVQGGLLDDTIATALLAGIMANTDRFTAQHTTAKSLTVAAQMMAMGGDQQRVIREVFGAREQGTRNPAPGSRSDNNARRDDRSKPRSQSPEPRAQSQDRSKEIPKREEEAKPTPLAELKNPNAQPSQPVYDSVPERQVQTPVVEQQTTPVDQTTVNVDAELDSFIHGDTLAPDNDLIYTQPVITQEPALYEAPLQWEQHTQPLSPSEDPLINS